MPTLSSIDGRSLALDLSGVSDQFEKFGDRRRAKKDENEKIELAQQARGIGQGTFPTQQATARQQEQAGGFLRKLVPGFADTLDKLNKTRDPESVDAMRNEAQRGRETADQILSAKTASEKQAIILKRASEIQQEGGDNRELLKAAGGTPAEMDLQAQKSQLTSNAALRVLPPPTQSERLRARAALSVRDPNALVAIQRDEAVARQIEAQKRAERRASAARGAKASSKQRISDLAADMQDQIDGIVTSTKEPDQPAAEVSTPAPRAEPFKLPETVDPALNEILGEPEGTTQADAVSAFNRENAQQDDTLPTNAADLSQIEVAAISAPQENITLEELSQPVVAPQRRGPSTNVRDAFQDELKAQEFLTNARSDEERAAAKNVLANAKARREILEEAGAFKGQTDLGKLVADQQEVITRFGADSPQAQAIGEMIEGEKSGAKPKLSDVAGLRKEFTAKSKDFITMSNAVKKVNASPESGAGDVALIFNYMKILDPNSVVRESEFATAENTAGIPTRVTQAYNKALTGERLTPEMRDNFKGAANTLFDTAISSQIRDENSFSAIAERLNMNPDNVVIDFIGDARNAPTADAPQPTQFSEGQTATNAAGETILFRGGSWQSQ